MSTPADVRPTGTIELRDGRHVLVQTREFRAPIEDVWAAVTEPDRLARWIGSWTGDPESGSVRFQMLFEEDQPGETMTIRVCEPPHRLHLTSQAGDEVWLLDVDLTHADGVTTLTLSQPGVTAEQASGVGPGWEYYLDRLVAAETGADPAARDFERDYYPAMSDYYRGQF
ncbi:SRPBCC family protein [Nocardioides dilutus]